MKKYLLLSIIISFSSLFSQRSNNLFTDGGFETWSSDTNLTNWTLGNNSATPSNNATYEKESGADNFYSGSFSVKYTTGSQAGKGSLQTPSDITIIDDSKIIFGIWIKGTSGTKIKMGYKKTAIVDGAVSYSANAYTLPDGDWHYVTQSLDVLAGDLILPRILPNANGLNSTFYLDGASLSEGLFGGNVEVDFRNGSSKSYSDIFQVSTYGSSGIDDGQGANIFSIITENSDASYVKNDNHSLKVTTTANASNVNRGSVTLKSNSTMGTRYVHNLNTSRNYQASCWIKTPTGTGDVDIVFVLKTGSNNSFKGYTISEDTWTEISTNVVAVSTEDEIIYPLIHFKNSSIVHYIDDMELNWSGSVTWDGSTDSDWHTGSNWIRNVEPNSLSDVTIPSGVTNYPTSTSDVTVNSLSMNSGSSFISGGSFSGTTSYTRNLSTTNWYGISSPVSGQDINQFITAYPPDQSSDNSEWGLTSSYSSNSQVFNHYAVSGSGFGNFLEGKAYFLKMASSGNIIFSGNIRNTDVSMTLNLDGTAFNFVANPYTSYMDTSAMLIANTNLLASETLWIWDQSVGTYLTKVSGESFKLAPTQAFFVKSDGTTTGSLALNQSYEVHNSTDTFKSSNDPEIYLTLTNESLTREARLFFRSNGTDGFDNGYDGAIFGGILNEFAIYTHYLDESTVIEDLSIQTISNNDYESKIVPIGINAVINSNITISASKENFPNNTNIYLEDRENNSFTLLNEESSFSTTLETDLDGIGRFYLHLSENTFNNEGFISSSLNVFKADSNSFITIEGLAIQSGSTNLNLYSLLGTRVLSSVLNNNNNTQIISTEGLSAGIYVIKLESGNDLLTKKLIIK